MRSRLLRNRPCSPPWFSPCRVSRPTTRRGRKLRSAVAEAVREDRRANRDDAPTKSFADAPTADQVKFFEAKIRPILVEQCYGCHSSETEKIRRPASRSTPATGFDAAATPARPSFPATRPRACSSNVLTTKDEDRETDAAEEEVARRDRSPTSRRG